MRSFWEVEEGVPRLCEPCEVRNHLLRRTAHSAVARERFAQGFAFDIML